MVPPKRSLCSHCTTFNLPSAHNPCKTTVSFILSFKNFSQRALPILNEFPMTFHRTIVHLNIPTLPPPPPTYPSPSWGVCGVKLTSPKTLDQSLHLQNKSLLFHEITVSYLIHRLLKFLCSGFFLARYYWSLWNKRNRKTIRWKHGYNCSKDGRSFPLRMDIDSWKTEGLHSFGDM